MNTGVCSAVAALHIFTEQSSIMGATMCTRHVVTWVDELVHPSDTRMRFHNPRSKHPVARRKPTEEPSATSLIKAHEEETNGRATPLRAAPRRAIARCSGPSPDDAGSDSILALLSVKKKRERQNFACYRILRTLDVSRHLNETNNL